MKEDEPNQQQKGNYFRKQLTRKRLANIIEISLDEKPFQLTCVNEKRHYEELTSYLGPKKNKKTKTISWEVIYNILLDVTLFNVHVTLFFALHVAYNLTQKQKMLLHLMMLFIHSLMSKSWTQLSEAALYRCSFEKVVCKYATNLQENTHFKKFAKQLY